MPHDSYPSPEPDFAALRLRLAQLRHERGWTYDEMASRSGVGRATLVTLESGRSRRKDGPPATHGTMVTWYRFAEALDMSLGELLAPLQPHRHRGEPSQE